MMNMQIVRLDFAKENKSMSDFNDIGISRELDWPHIKSC